MVEIKGIIPPVLTPMKEDEEIDYQELRNQVNRLLKAGVHGIFACGTNGEGYALDWKEKEKVLETVIDETAGRTLVYGGIGCVTTRETIRLAKRAEAMGCDVLSVITPWFAKASQKELYEHYKSIAEGVCLPILLYNIPARTGNALETDTVRQLSEIDNIVGIKDSSGNFEQMLQYMEATKDSGFVVLSGNDSLILKNLIAGGAGGIAGCANVYPENMVAIYENFVKGDLERAQQAQDAIQSFRSCFCYGNPNTIVKTAAAMLGWNVGKCRAPFDYVSDEGMKVLARILQENSVLGLK